MEQYYKPVIQEITRAQSVPSVTCQSIGTHPGVHAGAPGGWNGPASVAPEGKWDNDTAVLIAVTNFYATDEIDRDDPSKASTVFEVGDNVTWRMNRAIFKSRNQHQATFNRKMKMRIRNSFGGSRTRKRQLSDAAQAHVASLDGRTARNLQGAQYEMDYAYNASSALHFVDAANITWVTTEVVGSIAPSGVPTADPTATPTTPPSPEPTGVPTGTPTALPTTLPSPLPTPYPTAMCPSWATREGCAPNCLCCASYSEAKYRRPHETFYNEHMEKDFNPAEPDQCLMCDHGFKCVETGGDGQKDGDGTCEEMADYAYEGENMCDWWKWAYRYGPNKTETGPYATNWKTGHAYAEDGSLPKKWYSINGKNCSKWDVDVVSTDKCKGLFHYCNATHCDESTASGHKTLKHDREGTICYSDYRAPDFVGYCSYEVGPSHCARCVEGACGKGACVQASLGFELGGAAGDKTPEELTNDPVFTGGLKRSIAEACDFAALGLSEDNIKDLVISYGRRRLEVDEAGGAVEQRRLQTAFSVTYTIVYDPDVVAISVDTIAETVTAAAEEAIDEGSFVAALDTAMAEVAQELVDSGAINPDTGSPYTQAEADATTDVFVAAVVITETTVTVISTEAPTFWSDTEENMEPVIVSRRQGGVAVSDLPACGCDDDTTA